jgi:hypothetical protein
LCRCKSHTWNCAVAQLTTFALLAVLRNCRQPPCNIHSPQLAAATIRNSFSVSIACTLLSLCDATLLQHAQTHSKKGKKGKHHHGKSKGHSDGKEGSGLSAGSSFSASSSSSLAMFAGAGVLVAGVAAVAVRRRAQATGYQVKHAALHPELASHG